MSDISTITVNNQTYNIKDSDARLNKANIITAFDGGHVTLINDAQGGLASEAIVRVEPNQSGTGDPTPSNIRSISGWTGLTIKRLGKNFFNANNWTYTGSGSSITVNSINAITLTTESYQERYNYYTLPIITSRMFSFDYSVTATSNTSAKVILYGYKVDGTNITLATITAKNTSTTGTIAVKIPENVTNIRFGGWSYTATISITNMQLEFSSKTEYETYDVKDSISLDWTSQAGTIYGADVDIIAGTLTKTFEIIDLGTLNWNYHTQYPVFCATLSQAKQDGICICSQYINGNTNTSGKDNRIEIGKSGWFLNMVVVRDSAKGTDAAAFKTAMNGVKLVYELKEPGPSIQLTPNTIELISGLNNFIADAGPIYLSYKANTKAYIDKGKVYFVKGTQTLATNIWTGELPEVEELYEGLTINYWLSVAGNSTGATLDLILKNGKHTGPIPMFYSGTTRQTTHLPADNFSQFVYQTVCIGSTTYTGWWMIRTYQDGNTTNIVDLYDGSAVYKAHSAIYRYELLFQVSEYYLTPLNNTSNTVDTTKNMLTDVPFDAFGRIFYYYTTTTINADANIGSSNIYYHRNLIDARYTFNCGTTLTAHQNFYLKVIPQSGGMVKLASDPCWAQELPSSNDNCWYIFIGKAYSTYQIQLHTEHPVYAWIDDGWKQIFDPILACATATNTGLMSAADKIKLDGINPSGGDYQLPIASSTTLGGIKIGTNLSINSNGVLSATDTNTTYTAATTSIGSAAAGTAIKANNITSWSTGTLPTLGTAIAADDITSWSTGTLPTLGTAIPADDITSWSTGTLPVLGTAIPADDITSWTTGKLPTLGTAISADDITSWSTGVLPNATVENEVLTLTFGTLPSLQYTSRSIPNVTSVGTLPSLEYTSKSIPNVTSVGTLPNLAYTAKSVPNVTSVGTLPSLGYTSRSIPNVTNVGTLPSLQHTEKTIPNITVTSKTVVTGITAN